MKRRSRGGPFTPAGERNTHRGCGAMRINLNRTNFVYFVAIKYSPAKNSCAPTRESNRGAGMRSGEGCNYLPHRLSRGSGSSSR